MSFSSVIRGMLSKIEDWWKDGEDERLDEIVGLDSENAGNSVSDQRVMAYQLVRSARNSRGEH